MAPLNHYDTTERSDDSAVDANGVIRHMRYNVSDSSNMHMNFNLYYTSENDSDNYNNLGGWRNSFTVKLDDKTPKEYENIIIKSSQYDTMQDACETGWLDISSRTYRGAIESSIAHFDATTELCNLVDTNRDVIVAKLAIWDKDGGTSDKVHTLTRPNGQTFIFVKNSEGYFSPTTKENIHLEKVEGGYTFTDTNDAIEMHDDDGKLIWREFESKRVKLSYEDELLKSITGPYESEKIELQYNNKNQLIHLENHENNTLVNFDYNNDNLLSEVVDSDMTILMNTSYTNNLLSEYKDDQNNSLNYVYDDLGRTIRAFIPESTIDFIYEMNRVVRIVDEEKRYFTEYQVIHSISKPTIYMVEDYTQETTYNESGYITNVETSDASTKNLQNTLAMNTKSEDDIHGISISFERNSKGQVLHN